MEESKASWPDEEPLFYFQQRQEPLWYREPKESTSPHESFDFEVYDRRIAESVSKVLRLLDEECYENIRQEGLPHEECAEWRTTYPHLRLVGQPFNLEENGCWQAIPAEPEKKKIPLPPKSLQFNVSSQTPQESGLEIIGTAAPSRDHRIETEIEEIIAQHGINEDILAMDSHSDDKDQGEGKHVLSPVNSVKEEIKDMIFDALWEKIVSLISPCIYDFIYKEHDVSTPKNGRRSASFNRLPATATTPRARRLNSESHIPPPQYKDHRTQYHYRGSQPSSRPSASARKPVTQSASKAHTYPRKRNNFMIQTEASLTKQHSSTILPPISARSISHPEEYVTERSWSARNQTPRLPSSTFERPQTSKPARKELDKSRSQMQLYRPKTATKTTEGENPSQPLKHKQSATNIHTSTLSKQPTAQSGAQKTKWLPKSQSKAN